MVLNLLQVPREARAESGLHDLARNARNTSAAGCRFRFLALADRFSQGEIFKDLRKDVVQQIPLLMQSLGQGFFQGTFESGFVQFVCAMSCHPGMAGCLMLPRNDLGTNELLPASA